MAEHSCSPLEKLQDGFEQPSVAALQVDVSHTVVERLFVTLAGEPTGVLRRAQFVQARTMQVPGSRSVARAIRA